MLGADLDDKVQAYVKHVRDGGGTVSSKIVIAAFSCLATVHFFLRMVGQWAQPIFKRMMFI